MNPRLVRTAVRYLIRSVKVRIGAGPNQGLRWSLASAGRGYRTGTFETNRVLTIASLIQPGDCFWDIGAHKGYVTLVAAPRVGSKGKVYAFEPAQANLWFLRKHLQWNGLEHVRVTPAAISSYDGASRFGGGSSLAYRLGVGSEQVTVRSIQSLLDAGECEPPTFLKIDVEGAEADTLAGAGPYLENPNMLVLVSVHSQELYAVCTSMLRERGYRVIGSGQVPLAEANGWVGPTSPDGRGDPDILAIGPARTVAAEHLDRFVMQ
jgi:FkbM family methyltransferase